MLTGLTQDIIKERLFFLKHKVSVFICRHKRPLFWATLAVFLSGFCILTAYVIFTSPQYIDLRISEEIKERQNGVIVGFMKAVSWLGRIRVLAVLVGVSSLSLLLLKRKREALMILSTLISGGASWVVKALINRPRPTNDFVSILEETHYQSFPSGHVFFYTSFFGTLLLIMLRSSWKMKVKIVGVSLCLLTIFLGAVSRVYLGAHWFTDVLGGFMAGIIYLLIAGNIYLRNRLRKL